MPRRAERRLGTIATLVLLLIASLVAGAPLASARTGAPDSAVVHPSSARAAARVTIFYDYLAAPWAGGRAYRPHRFTFAADPQYLLQRMRWGRWTQTRAVGRGYYFTDYGHGGYLTAVGPFATRWRVRVTFWRPRQRCGHRVFTRARFAFPQRPGTARTFVIGRPPHGFPCP